MFKNFIILSLLLTSCVSKTVNTVSNDSVENKAPQSSRSIASVENTNSNIYDTPMYLTFEASTQTGVFEEKWHNFASEYRVTNTYFDYKEIRKYNVRILLNKYRFPDLPTCEVKVFSTIYPCDVDQFQVSIVRDSKYVNQLSPRAYSTHYKVKFKMVKNNLTPLTENGIVLQLARTVNSKASSAMNNIGRDILLKGYSWWDGIMDNNYGGKEYVSFGPYVSSRAIVNSVIPLLRRERSIRLDSKTTVGQKHFPDLAELLPYNEVKPSEVEQISDFLNAQYKK